MNLTDTAPDTNELTPHNVTSLKEAQALAVIVTDGEYARAGALLAGTHDMVKRLSAYHDPRCDAAHQAHKACTSERLKDLGPWEEAKKKLGMLMGTYDWEQRRRQEVERLRIETVMRQQEETQRLAEAVEAEQRGDTAEALAIIEAPLPVQQVVMPPPVPKVAGTAKAPDKWEWRLSKGPTARGSGPIVRSSVLRDIPDQYWVLDESKISGIVRVNKMLHGIPGIEAFLLPPSTRPTGR